MDKQLFGEMVDAEAARAIDDLAEDLNLELDAKARALLAVAFVAGFEAGARRAFESDERTLRALMADLSGQC